MAETPPLDRFTAFHRAIKECVLACPAIVGSDSPPVTPLVKPENVCETTDDDTLDQLLNTLQEAHTPRIEIVQGAWSFPQTIKPTEQKIPVRATCVVWLTTTRVRIQELNRVKLGLIAALSVAPNTAAKPSIHFGKRGLFRLPWLTDWTINAADRTSGDVNLGPGQVISRGTLRASSVLSVTAGWVWSFGDLMAALESGI